MLYWHKARFYTESLRMFLSSTEKAASLHKCSQLLVLNSGASTSLLGTNSFIQVCPWERREPSYWGITPVSRGLREPEAAFRRLEAGGELGFLVRNTNVLTARTDTCPHNSFILKVEWKSKEEREKRLRDGDLLVTDSLPTAQKKQHWHPVQ